ncbi:Fe(2+)-trafficking protein [Phycisphaerales bacterium AB-hyl4]|uniref:Fe(2+)-trafficking protein n=1 Tax=Natronomicrosphaera hydrolytica TaxID=3242702 RepID=A0ABV4U283_9BACT
MATLEERIAQWEQMAREAPDDMAFFSLGSAYREAERFEDADRAFAKAIEMNDGMSRAYQLRGQVLIKLGREEEAGDLLTTGYKVAAERGDVMPQRAIGSMLEKLGKPLPEVQSAEERKAEVESDDTVLDRRTGQPQQRLPDPPMRGPVGKFIYDHFGQETWRTWIGQGTKVINELRLDFSNPQHQDVYEQYMLEWLQVTREEVDEYAKQAEQE